MEADPYRWGRPGSRAQDDAERNGRTGEVSTGVLKRSCHFAAQVVEVPDGHRGDLNKWLAHLTTDRLRAFHGEAKGLAGG